MLAGMLSKNNNRISNWWRVSTPIKNSFRLVFKSVSPHCVPSSVSPHDLSCRSHYMEISDDDVMSTALNNCIASRYE